MSELPPAKSKTYLEEYLGVFGDKSYQYIDVYPEGNADYDETHLALSERFTAHPASEKEVAEAAEYKHCCWCNPELIYTDDLRGNEVWLHKRVQ